MRFLNKNSVKNKIHWTNTTKTNESKPCEFNADIPTLAIMLVKEKTNSVKTETAIFKTNGVISSKKYLANTPN